MKKEFKEGILILGDAVEELKKIPDESIDCIITDPPYNISQEGKRITRKNMNSPMHRRNSDIKLDFGEWDRQWGDEKEYFYWTEEWFRECVRVLKKGGWIYVFFDKFKTGFFDLFLAPKYGIKSKTILVWCKTNPPPSFRKVNWISATEFIWAGVKGEGKPKNFLSQREMLNYFLYPNSSTYKETKHPTEKPVVIIRKLILASTDKGDTVLDPFAGSGTTAVACIQTERKFICVEKSEEYFKEAIKRIKKYEQKLTLFGRTK